MRTAVRRSLVLLLSISTAAACAKGRVAAPPDTVAARPARTGAAASAADAPAASSVSAQLRQELARAFDDSPVGGLWAVEIQSLDTGELIYQRNAQLLVMPASNMKIVTMAVAAERLGWDFRFTTEVKAAGAIAGGTLTGDLVVVGGGDPTISERDGDRFRVFEGWADQLRAAGLTRIDGRIIGDDNLFDDAPLGEGWMWDDLNGSSAPPGGALQFNENLVRVVVTPATVAGQPASVRLDPEGSGLTLQASVMTIAPPPAPGGSSGVGAGTGTAPPSEPPATMPRQLSLSRALGGTTLDVRGVIPIGAKEVVRTTPVENPTIFFVNALRNTLIRKGIAVTGPAVDIDALPPPASILTSTSGSAASATAGGTVLITHRSPPLSDVGRTFMKVSQNLFGETLMTTVGARSGRAAKFDEAWTAGGAAHHHVEAAREVYEELLASWGVPESQHVIADGSGLSRYNYVTAHLLVRILRQMALDPRHAAAFEATLPIAGKDGTLNRRMRGTKAENNVRAKTGTISNVRSLSGYVRTLDGERIGFSIIANNFKAPTATVDAVAELAVERLANFTRASVMRPQP